MLLILASSELGDGTDKTTILGLKNGELKQLKLAHIIGPIESPTQLPELLSVHFWEI